MKIGVYSIIRDHFATLCEGGRWSTAVWDFLIFFGGPLVLSLFAFERNFELKTEAYNVSITFFGIFIALLLNIQVAIFSIFQRKWQKPTDPIEAQQQERVIETRRLLLEELNANISYLVLTCCIALVAALTFYVKDWDTGWPPSAILFLYAHFLLTLLMIIKRSHALFQKEYQSQD